MLLSEMLQIKLREIQILCNFLALCITVMKHWYIELKEFKQIFTIIKCKHLLMWICDVWGVCTEWKTYYFPSSFTVFLRFCQFVFSFDTHNFKPHCDYCLSCVSSTPFSPSSSSSITPGILYVSSLILAFLPMSSRFKECFRWPWAWACEPLLFSLLSALAGLRRRGIFQAFHTRIVSSHPHEIYCVYEDKKKHTYQNNIAIKKTICKLLVVFTFFFFFKNMP